MGLLALIVGESVLKQSKGKKTSKTREDAGDTNFAASR